MLLAVPAPARLRGARAEAMGEGSSRPPLPEAAVTPKTGGLIRGEVRTRPLLAEPPAWPGGDGVLGVPGGVPAGPGCRRGPVPSWVLVGAWAAASCLLRSGAFYKMKGNKKEEGKKKKEKKLYKKKKPPLSPRAITPVSSPGAQGDGRCRAGCLQPAWALPVPGCPSPQD